MRTATSRTRAARRYAFDEDNRLVMRERVPGTPRLEVVRVLEGEIRTDARNRLVYRVGRSGPEAPVPSQDIAFDGTWALTSEHALVFTLHERQAQAHQALYLKGAMMRAEGEGLVFALRRHVPLEAESGPPMGGDDAAATQTVTLTGRWRADAKNRLNFLVARGEGREDRLTLQGGWELSPRQALVYRYQVRFGARHRRAEQTVIFQGMWDIPQGDRLVYRLSGGRDSAFEFRVGLRSPSLSAGEGRIVYDVAVGVAQGGMERRRLVLAGAWKLHRDASVSFEMASAGGRVQTLRFEGSVALTARSRVVIALRNSRREALGMTVTFTRALGRDVEWFLSLRQDPEERAALGGIRVRF